MSRLEELAIGYVEHLNNSSACGDEFLLRMFKHFGRELLEEAAKVVDSADVSDNDVVTILERAAAAIRKLAVDEVKGDKQV